MTEYIYDPEGHYNSPAAFTASTNNQNPNLAYDAAGNTTRDIAGNIYTYDAEDRITPATSGGATSYYTYRADGQRATKQTGSRTYYYSYDFDNNLVARYQSGQGITGVTLLTQEVWLNGAHLGTIDGLASGIARAAVDQIGSERVEMDGSGNIDSASYSLPFGDDLTTFMGTRYSPLYFTGKERDSESGLDYFGARYYANSMGRFISPDWSRTPTAVPYALLNNPQSLNLYAYAGNNPLSRTDPDGHFWEQLKNLFGDAGCWCNAAQAATAIQNLRNDLQTWQAKFDGKTPDYQNLTPRQARSYHDQFTTAADAFDQQQKEQAGQLPFLRFLHGSDTRSNIDSIRKMSTEDIIESLKPGNAESLKVKMNGTVMNGNTRLRVLEERGVDIENLPRDIHTSEPVGPSLGEEIEGIGEDPLP